MAPSNVSPALAVGSTANMSPYDLRIHDSMTVHTEDAVGRDSSYTELFDYRGGPLRPCRKDVVFGSWNVEGLTESKIAELQEHMRTFNIDTLAIQETHKP
eukprot:3225927-Pyramimonas_sp.AAC.1